MPLKEILLFLLCSSCHTLHDVVGEREVSAIGRGICVLLGISRDDTQQEAEWMYVQYVIVNIIYIH